MIETLNNMADKWFNWEFAIAWQVAVLIAIIWVIDLLIRKWAWPQVRYALWLLVLVKLDSWVKSPNLYRGQKGLSALAVLMMQTPPGISAP